MLPMNHAHNSHRYTRSVCECGQPATVTTSDGRVCSRCARLQHEANSYNSVNHHAATLRRNREYIEPYAVASDTRRGMLAWRMAR